MKGCKLLKGINSVYVNGRVCARVKGYESECFRIDSGVRHVCTMSPWLFNVYIYRRSEEGVENGNGEEGSEIL